MTSTTGLLDRTQDTVSPDQPGMPGSAETALQARPNLVLAIIAAGALAAVGLWWHNTPAIHGFGDWLTNGGRIAGLLSGYGVVVLVAMMARIPPLGRGIGAAR